MRPSGNVFDRSIEEEVILFMYCMNEHLTGSMTANSEEITILAFFFFFANKNLTWSYEHHTLHQTI